ncbi:response regulator transcription factor [Oceanobacillus jeddahense]|uniref:Response regulator transcription factor n=1 Tax=Oceanobacillus jeddahense TaxID=1462527 RepID=A0ABY5JWR8_9BACI|nr:response regulator transcription factor [Oceanobacillus jeddahense]UUI04776.1 response regulator transcription factor [Oceanobacillus jeddahense]
MHHKILVVEDDSFISNMIDEGLTKEGFTVTAAFDGEEALEKLSQHSYDVILLDWMLPKIDGIECLKAIRSKSMVPILMLSAKGEDVDKALGLGFGADDYISKPFSMLELIARIKAMLRREQHYMDTSAPKEVEKNKNDIVALGELRIDMDNFSVKKRGNELNLTAKEFNILKVFITHPSRVYTKAQLYQAIWHDAYQGDENVINVHMRRLREKIEDDPSQPVYIKTLWGIGYKLGEL